MATYTELAAINFDPGWGALLNKIMVAVMVKAATIIDSASPSADALAWAKATLTGPKAAANNIAFYVIASNKAASISTILAASDSAVQSNVDDAVDAMYGS